MVIFSPPLADIAERYLRKGSSVYVEGQLQTRKWQDQNGQDRYSTEVVLRPYRGELHMLDGRGNGGEQSGYSAGAEQGASSQAPQSAPVAPLDDDEIPF